MFLSRLIHPLAFSLAVIAAQQSACATSPAGSVPTRLTETTAAFSAAPVSDSVLAMTSGSGLDRYGLLRRIARDQSENFDRQTAEIMGTTFDNWLNDVGTPLIVANISR